METQKLEKVTPIDPVFINTPTGSVAVFGHEHVSPKMLQMLGTILSHDAFETIYHGVKSVVFRVDGYPKEGSKEICANFAPDTGGMAINMVKTMERALDRSTEHPSTSLMASWWMEMFLNFSHEVHHAVMWDTDRDRLHHNESNLQEEEELAEKYSTSLLVDLVKEYDIEPPTVAEEVWFNGQVSELLSDKDDKWVNKQRQLVSDGYMWVYEEVGKESVILASFKDFICLLSDGDVESEEWNKETITLSTGVKTLKDQLETNTPVIPVAEAVETVVNPSDVYAQAEINEDFHDILNEMGMDTVPATPAPAPVPVTTYDLQEQVQEALPTADHTGVQVGMATAGRLAKQVYMKMYDFIFTQCGPKQNSDIGFATPEAVCSNPIPLTNEEAALFTTMNHLDINGRWCPDAPTTNGLLGKVMKNTKLPAYEVTLNLNGTIYKRLFMPQNPSKRNATGQLTQRAIEAQAGNAIAYVINTDDNTANKWGPSIVNGEYKAGS